VAEKGYKSADMFKNWKCLLFNGEPESSTMVWRVICNDVLKWNRLITIAMPIFRSIDENDKADQIMENLIKCLETTAEGNFYEKRNYMDAIIQFWKV
jgi:hypothetical protein